MMMRRSFLISVVKSSGGRRFHSQDVKPFYVQNSDGSYSSIERILTDDAGKMIKLIAAPTTAMPTYWENVRDVRLAGAEAIILGEIHNHTQGNIPKQAFSLAQNLTGGHAAYMIPNFLTVDWLTGPKPIHMLHGEYNKEGWFSSHRKQSPGAAQLISEQVITIIETNQYSQVALLHDCTSLKVIYNALINSGYVEFVSVPIPFCDAVTATSSSLHKVIALQASDSIQNRSISPYFYRKAMRIAAYIFFISMIIFWLKKNIGGGSPPSPKLHSPPNWEPVLPLHPTSAAAARVPHPIERS
eukprot:TRINITY_DN30772_c0_g1_i1.p1 TRINITY_DN30772_c0_g1~~TRINITY_DN30772_c0_g1_i1.p1  ORF type:complete len:299 (+),score=33.33 TRINITY_DN30772_c0_g1_i1:53-949(+)